MMLKGLTIVQAGRLRRVDPPDYEKELLAKKEDLKQDDFPNLLLFPQQDVSVW